MDSRSPAAIESGRGVVAMSKKTFKIAALALGGLIVLAASVDAANGTDSPSVLAQALCSACELIHSLVH